MSDPRHRVVGIIAGGGSLPREVAESVRADGAKVLILAIEGESDDSFAGFQLERLGWGKFGRLLRLLRAAEVTDLVILGRVRRPDLWAVRPDFGLFRHLPEIVRIVASAGDDNLLRRVGRFFEARGMALRGAAEIAPGLVIGDGPLTSRPMPAAAASDAALGFALIDELGALDVGQAVIVRDGRIEAVEAAEGTDGLLDRCARAATAGERRGVLVKAPKPGQELRLDMPAIGPGTVERAKRAGLAGIAVRSGATLVAERAQLVRVANEAEMFVEGFGHVPVPGNGMPAPAPALDWRPDRLAAALRRDADTGVRALRVMEAYGGCRALVVSNGYILSLAAAGEDGLEAIARSGRLRQWGRARSKRRSGVAVLGSDAPLTAEIVEAVDTARLAGLAITGNDAIDDRLAARAKAAGLALARCSTGFD